MRSGERSERRRIASRHFVTACRASHLTAALSPIRSEDRPLHGCCGRVAARPYSCGPLPRAVRVILVPTDACSDHGGLHGTAHVVDNILREPTTQAGNILCDAMRGAVKRSTPMAWSRPWQMPRICWRSSDRSMALLPELIERIAAERTERIDLRQRIRFSIAQRAVRLHTSLSTLNSVLARVPQDVARATRVQVTVRRARGSSADRTIQPGISPGHPAAALARAQSGAIDRVRRDRSAGEPARR